MKKSVLFGTSSWGLGHATRDLGLMRALLEADCALTVVATGNALRVLRAELGGEVRYCDWPDMPTTVAKTRAGFYAKIIAHIPAILGSWFADRRRLKRFLADHAVDVVVSDHRYGLVTGSVPCYFISHSPRYIAPWRSAFMEAVMEAFIARWLRPVRAVLIPDDFGAGYNPNFDALQGGLSGDMSHALRYLPPEKRVFLGILSSLKERKLPRDIDAFITISGPEPQRSQLERRVLSQLDGLSGRVALALGRPGGRVPQVPSHVEAFAYLDRAGQEEMMNRAKVVVCRSGYTTLMELAELGRPALLVPTPGQSEQEYLARTLKARGLFHSVDQGELDLARDVARARELPGYRPAGPTAVSVRRFLRIVLGEAGQCSAP